MEYCDHKGRSPLWLAVKVESEESAGILIKAGANIESADNRGRKVVDMARGAITKEMLTKMAAERWAPPRRQSAFVLLYSLEVRRLTSITVPRDELQDIQHKADMTEAARKFNAKPSMVRLLFEGRRGSAYVRS